MLEHVLIYFQLDKKKIVLILLSLSIKHPLHNPKQTHSTDDKHILQRERDPALISLSSQLGGNRTCRLPPFFPTTLTRASQLISPFITLLLPFSRAENTFPTPPADNTIQKLPSFRNFTQNLHQSRISECGQ